ncbi:MAG TPA: glycosyltransferase [Candidatus Bathyarchaeia archaeon]|nr:glycosyltransferase [Candidatus Bathyarchaeia archaeon]
MNRPTVSINVCVYKPGAFLAQALECMAAQETRGLLTFEILVIDDEPSANTERFVGEFAKSAAAPVRYVQAEGKGVSHARNTGIRESRGDWIAWFDQDQTTGPSWLSALYSTADETGADWVDGPRDLLLTADQAAGLNAFLRACLGEIGEGDTAHRMVRRYASCTGNALVRKAALDAVGAFDETIFDGWEDWDYVRRFRAKGYPCWYTPKAIVHHVVPAERLEASFFRWHAARLGAAFASRDVREWGLFRAVLASVARLGQTLLVHGPLLAWARMRADGKESLTRWCLVLRAVSYARKTLYYVSPGLFSQPRYHARLQLRNEPRYAARRGP